MITKKTKNRIKKYVKQTVIFFHYLKKIKFRTKGERRIIICFDGLISHGGLVDRLKGIISFYEIAKQLDYEFSIYFSHPFHLEDYLIPNEINWNIGATEINYYIGQTSILYLMNDFCSNPLEKIKESKTKTVIVYCNVDYLPKIYINNSEEKNRFIWRENFWKLFRISPYLEDFLNKLPKCNRIAVHTRFTSLMGDFEDTTSIILDDQEKKTLCAELVEKIYGIASENIGKEIFVLSDSVFFLDYIKNTTAFKTLEGEPSHIDLQLKTKVKAESDIKTFTDFLFLSDSCEVYLLKNRIMYDSAFSKYASIIGDKKFTKIEF